MNKKMQEQYIAIHQKIYEEVLEAAFVSISEYTQQRCRITGEDSMIVGTIVARAFVNAGVMGAGAALELPFEAISEISDSVPDDLFKKLEAEVIKRKIRDDIQGLF